ncbi:S8 family serine peptidase [Blastococcus mobilis]|uniref:Serine protease AprX n=1 Tax=Blastococcus mobilis TaxID=1938746 RepID=A0A238X1E0_9ACTN|nr:S8 family serine peptidase [Blastococcus mobilis]SNR52687.1 serine protease AprX [Blastococcus mobilis]
MRRNTTTKRLLLAGLPSGGTRGGLSHISHRVIALATAAAVAVGLAGPAAAQASTDHPAEPVEVIVQKVPGAATAPEGAVTALGGTVGEPLGIINGFSATLPAARLDALRVVPGVASVTEDASVRLHSSETAATTGQAGSMYRITHEVTGATALWERGITGRGVDVAVIDSGIVPVEGLNTKDKVVYGPDLSFEAEVCAEAGCTAGPAENLDSYGHGTNMAGIIAGRDSNANPRSYRNPDTFAGMAPDARIVSVKVADATGATDVSQVIAAIDWVVQNKDRNGLNIRVLNLSFGTDGVQSYQLDPLTYATEVAWRSGIAVVVAAGNGGYGTAKLNNPAYDPYLIAVGGADSRGTYGVQDDVVPSWSSTGDGTRNPDLVAPGASVVSLRSPGSYLDTQYPAARQGERFFRGSGTSQAAAVVSGAAALLFQQRPQMTPDQLKALLMSTAETLPVADRIAQGEGMLDLVNARDAATPESVQTWPRATGTGSLEAARGSAHIAIDGVELAGETDATGTTWSPATWAPAAAAGRTWQGGTVVEEKKSTGFTAGAWNGAAWTGHTWNSDGFYGQFWDGTQWIGPWSEGGDSTLEAKTWSAKTWSAKTWSAKTWSAKTWSAKTWSAKTWSAKTWSAAAWGA